MHLYDNELCQCVALFTGKLTLQLLKPQHHEIQTERYENHVTLTVHATGLEPLTYQWMKEKEPLKNSSDYSGVQTNRLNIPSMTRNHEGTYTCKVSNSTGTKISPSIKLRGNKIENGADN